MSHQAIRFVSRCATRVGSVVLRAVSPDAERRGLASSGKTIAVLGMHRSGTSCLTGLLEQAGVFLGEVSRKNPANPRGNRENPRIMALHEELLRVNGGSWDAPPRRVVWPQELKAARDDIIKSYDGVPLWGFKDPRTLLVVDGWLEALGALQFVGVFRHPMLTAESLRRRNGFPLEKGLRLWVEYNQRLLRYQTKFGFPVVSFDSETFLESFLRVARLLGLPPVERAALDFFDPELRHAIPDESPALPRNIKRLHRALVEIAVA